MSEFLHVCKNVYISLQWRTQEFSTGGAYPAFLVLVFSAPMATRPNLLSCFQRTTS